MVNIMNKTNGQVKRIKIGLVIWLLAALTGCAGFWSGGYYYGDEVMVPGPDMFLFGDDYYRGREVHNYSHRGSESRSAAHHSGGGRGSESHGTAHPGAWQGGRR